MAQNEAVQTALAEMTHRCEACGRTDRSIYLKGSSYTCTRCWNELMTAVAEASSRIEADYSQAYG